MVNFEEGHVEMLERIKNIIGHSDIVINGDIVIEGKGETKKSTQKIRSTPGVNSWKHKVKERDKVCQCCGSNGQLEVHHVMPLSEYPMLASDIHNGMVLCQECHRDYHKQWEGSEGAATLTKFLRENGRFL